MNHLNFKPKEWYLREFIAAIKGFHGNKQLKDKDYFGTGSLDAGFGAIKAEASWCRK